MKDEQATLLYCSKEDTRVGKIYKSDNIILPQPLKIIKELRPFQQDLVNIIKEPADDRTIIWIADINGNIGKSALAKYLIHRYGTIYITEGKKNDIMNIVYNASLTQNIHSVVIDVPRANGNHISYKSLEEIKNGIIQNHKYETGTKLINPPHIIVFANAFPIVEQFTSDRWKVFTVDNMYNLVSKDIDTIES